MRRLHIALGFAVSITAPSASRPLATLTERVPRSRLAIRSWRGSRRRARAPSSATPTSTKNASSALASSRLVSVDGQLNPAPLVLRAGVAYRLRFLNMTVRRPTLQVDLMRDSTLLQWRRIAADGASLPGAHSPTQAHRLIALGETFDVEVTPGVPGDQRLEIRIGGRFPPHTLLGTLPVRVVP